MCAERGECLSQVSNFSALPEQHGGFLGNCPAHCQTGRASHGHDPAHRTPDPWEDTTINGTAMGKAFASWYAARAAEEPQLTAALSVGGGDEATAATATAGAFRWVAAATMVPTPPDTCGYWD